MEEEILEAKTGGISVVLVDLRYPYGKKVKKVYLSGSLYTTGARFKYAGMKVKFLDFNIDDPNSPSSQATLSQADIIGVSVVGSPYMKNLISFCKLAKKRWPSKPVLLGGQVMLAFSNQQFNRLFAGTNAVLVKKDADLAPFGILPEMLSPALSLSLVPVLEALGNERLKIYLSHEMPLVISQGCIYRCSFCAAAKNQPERFKALGSFSQDMEFMANKAKEFGLSKLEFYATSLDFFQTPSELEKILQSVATIRQETGIDIQIRALACLNSFLSADQKISNLGQLLKNAGFWCVGFGVDGPSREIWKSQLKTQNHESDIPKVLQKTREMGLVTEILMIMGDQRYDLPTLIKTIHFSYGFAIDWPHTVLRIHLAKIWPGSDDWFTNQEYVNQLLDNPGLFSNLDALALASPVTNRDWKQRWQTNLAYLSILLPLRLTKRCISSTILPQGGYGPLALLARIVNRFMPFDR